MSEQQAEQTSCEPGSLGAGSAVPNSSDPRIDRLMTSEQAARNVYSPNIVPDQDQAAKADDMAFALEAETIKAEMPKAEPFTVAGFKVDAPKPDTLKPDTPKPDTPPKGDAPRADGPKADALKNDRRNPDTAKTDAVGTGATRPRRELLILSPGEGTWKRGEDRFESGNPAPKPDKEMPTRRRRFAAIAAMLLLAVIAGAAGGAFAIIGLPPRAGTTAAAAPDIAALEVSVGRIDTDIMALKARLERTTNESLTQFNKTSDRLERIEKAQAEPAAKLAKLGDAVDKLRATTSAATTVATVAPNDLTGTVTTPAGAQPLPTSPPHAPPAVGTAGNAPMSEVGRLPTIEGWVLRDVSHGSALIEGRIGLYDVFAGDFVPGLGRIEVIRKQDGRWVVVTPKGLIVAR